MVGGAPGPQGQAEEGTLAWGSLVPGQPAQAPAEIGEGASLLRGPLREELARFAGGPLRRELEDVTASLRQDLHGEISNFVHVFELWAMGAAPSPAGGHPPRGGQQRERRLCRDCQGGHPQTAQAAVAAAPGVPMPPEASSPSSRPFVRPAPPSLDALDAARKSPSPPLLLERESSSRAFGVAKDMSSHEWTRRHMRGFKSPAARSDLSRAGKPATSTVSGLLTPAGSGTCGARPSPQQGRAGPHAFLQGITPLTVESVSDASPTAGQGGLLEMSLAEASKEDVPDTEVPSKDSPKEAWVTTMHGPTTQAQTAGLSLSGELSEEQSLGFVGRIVHSDAFDYAVGLLVFLNVVAVSIQVDYMARKLVDRIPPEMLQLEAGFCLLFVVELSLRVAVDRSRYFCGQAATWNMFDIVVVGLHVLEVVLHLAGTLRESLNLDASFLRMLRLLRVVRVVRSIRVMRLFGELRTLSASLKWSLSSLTSTMALLMMIILSLGICLTQVVTDFRVQHKDYDDTSLALYYGSLGSTMLSLYQAITGGIDWREAMLPLERDVSPVCAVVFSLYIAFVFFAVLNIVTGVFVQSSLENSKEDMDWLMVRNINSLLAMMTQRAQNMELTWKDFERYLDHPQMRAYFQAIDVDPSEAKGVFELLDLNGNGSIDTDEFLSGCLRLRGPAKALDMQLLMREVRRIGAHVASMAMAPSELEDQDAEGGFHHQVSGSVVPSQERATTTTTAVRSEMSREVASVNKVAAKEQAGCRA